MKPTPLTDEQRLARIQQARLHRFDWCGTGMQFKRGGLMFDLSAADFDKLDYIWENKSFVLTSDYDPVEFF